VPTVNHAVSAPVQQIVGTLLLHTGFCLVLIVGPPRRSTLAGWSLKVRLEAESQEVYWHHLRSGEVDLGAVIEASSTKRPIVFIEGLEAIREEEMKQRITEMNLQRDTWGRDGARVIFWCDRRTLQAVWRFAPDLLHWRSMIQPLEPTDLSVFDAGSYLAWCVDTYREYGEDRVAAGSGFLLIEPNLSDSSGLTPFSEWVRAHRCGVVIRERSSDPRYPAKLWCRWAAHARLFDGDNPPLPILIQGSEVAKFAAHELSLGEIPAAEGIFHVLMAEEHIIFVIDDGTTLDAETLNTLALVEQRRLILITEDIDRIPPSIAWPRAETEGFGGREAPSRRRQEEAQEEEAQEGVLCPPEPRRESSSPHRRFFAPKSRESSPGELPFGRYVREIDRLLSSLFSRVELRLFIASYYSSLAWSLPGATVSMEELTLAAAEMLLRRGFIDTVFFERLIHMRPRHRAEIEALAEMFRDLSRFS